MKKSKTGKKKKRPATGLKKKAGKTVHKPGKKKVYRKSGKSNGRKTRNRAISPKRSLLKEIGIAAALTIALFIVFVFATCTLPVAKGYSMTPTVNDQDRLVVYKWGEIRRFSLVYFQNPEKGNWLIRRVIGRPGETVEYRNGLLYINGEEIPERFLPALFEEGTENPVTADFQLPEGKIPNGKYFVLGDNRSYATDSRYFGLIDEKEIKGTVTARIFPIHAMRQF